ncbi:MAG: ATP phosphoribosyltransferase regulatory subunit [Rhodospirillales bacterium]|nr:ATP phosphoribosyltransferase regulatory subunit [Rhodospirillales bacterium]
MNNKADKALLPAGLSDVLAPDAAFEASVLEILLSWFSGHGYDRVAPPLIEFEDALLTGIGAGLAEQTFRLMDPESQKMMAVRADMTPQVARIASARLSQAPRPLRLSYAGQILRVKGSQLRPERQFTQVGAELIGSPEPGADAEIIATAAGALKEIGVADLSCDIGLPTLVPAILKDGGDETTRERLRQALDRKDAAAVLELGGKIGEETAKTLSALLAAAGPAGETLKKVASLGLKGAAKKEWNFLVDVVNRIGATKKGLALTIDPVENRGFEYHTGVTFTFFAKGVRGELGSGGRYVANGNGSEPATGVTLFMDTVLRAVPSPKTPDRIFLPAATPADEAAKLRGQGWIAVAGLSKTDNPGKEAKRLGCSHWLAGGKIEKVGKN